MNKLIEEDLKARQQALNPTQSFIVQAPAGSGKTELLIQRLLTLLKTVNSPEEILAITFTKKAANEMRMRVVSALFNAAYREKPSTPHAEKTWLLARDVLHRDKEFSWDLVNNPNRLRIQTIDSLCAFLTNQLPLLSSFGAQPSIAENPDWIYQMVVQEVLGHVEYDYEWSQAISNLLLHLDNDLNKLHDLLVESLKKRDQWLPHIQFNNKDEMIREYLEQQSQQVISEHLQILHSLFPQATWECLEPIIKYLAQELKNLSVASRNILACSQLNNLPGTKANEKNAWLGIAELLLTKSFSWRKRVDESIGFPALKNFTNTIEKKAHTEIRTRLTTLIAGLSEQEELRRQLEQLFFLPDNTYSEADWLILKDLISVLKIAAAQLRVGFQQYGKIDFVENAQAALTALGEEENPTDLALALDYQMRHILIDEFQDTSYSQYKLLEKLCLGWESNDGRTLFIVGDPMQSIYRFREAEVGLFIRMREKGFGNLHLHPITLAINFRSTPKIVNWNNNHFQKIFPSKNNIGTGAVNYSPSIAHALTHTQSNIEVYGFEEVDHNLQALKIVEVVQSLLKSQPNDSIAILVRSRTHLLSLIPELKRAHIPYQALDIDPLATRQYIQDLFSLTCALLHLADRISWLSTLRAPWCGLTLADLLIIAGQNPSATIWECLNNKAILTQLSPDGFTRIQKVFGILENAIANRQRFELRTWVESTWIALGGPACLHEINDTEDVKTYFRLLENFSSDDQYLQIHFLKEKINKLYSSSSHPQAQLQIMTIHSAKGLEFDCVIMPHLEKKTTYDDKGLLTWLEHPLKNGKMALLLAPINATGELLNGTYNYIRREQKIKSTYETDRLLYVAATRAKKNLYLLFNLKKNADAEYIVEQGSFLDKLWPFFKNDLASIMVNTNPTPEMDVQETLGNLHRLASSWVNPIAIPFAPKVSVHQTASGFVYNHHHAKILGTVVHRILQQISIRGISWWEDSPAQTAYINNACKQAGLSIRSITNTIHLIEKIIHNTLQDERGRWILSPHEEAQSEYSLSVLLNNKLEKLIIDRTFIDNGTRWIIDYKTTALNQKDYQDFMQHEKEKYYKQLTKYKTALQLAQPHPIRIGLYFPAIPAWLEYENDYENVNFSLSDSLNS